MASLVLIDSSQLTADGFEKLPDQIINNQPAMKWCAVVSVVTAMLVVGVAGSPVPQESDASLPTWRTRGVKPVQEDKAAYIKKLEAELVTAVEAGAVAEAVRMEQQLEDEILVSAVRTLYKDRDDKEKLEEDKKMIAELVKRDKRAVELLSGVLGSSSGGGSSGGGEGSEDGGGSNILSLITPLLGSSSGGGGDDGADGGGSNVLSLLSGLLGGSSGGGGDGESGGGSNVLSLLSGLLGSSSGGGGDGEDGGGSNVLSLVSGLFGSSSGGGGASVGGSVSYKGATYDDLIKQSRDENSFNPLSLLTNSISQVLQVKFTVFRSVLSLVGNLFSGSSSSSGSSSPSSSSSSSSSSAGASSGQYLPPVAAPYQ
uniref:Uncharacterized protein n=1 Tax=Timema bartmani TaxID=61472 RepID=A0A7R9ERN5_9NEOP|nr:unnamed protein product [Timema bartmani]